MLQCGRNVCLGTDDQQSLHRGLGDEKVEAWGGKGTCPRSHSQVAVKPACLQNHDMYTALNRAAVAHLPGQRDPVSDEATNRASLSCEDMANLGRLLRREPAART